MPVDPETDRVSKFAEWLMGLRTEAGRPGNPVPLPHNMHWAIAERLAELERLAEAVDVRRASLQAFPRLIETKLSKDEIIRLILDEYCRWQGMDVAEVVIGGSGAVANLIAAIALSRAEGL